RHYDDCNIVAGLLDDWTFKKAGEPHKTAIAEKHRGQYFPQKLITVAETAASLDILETDVKFVNT
ncbi:MAG: hypothetical protein ACYC4Q_08265, partial [Victivallaceae bacterium]